MQGITAEDVGHKTIDLHIRFDFYLLLCCRLRAIPLLSFILFKSIIETMRGSRGHRQESVEKYSEILGFHRLSMSTAHDLCSHILHESQISVSCSCFMLAQFIIKPRHHHV